MYQINTITKKFTEAVTIDLGQLPTVDTRIDFILTDGTNPVIAENKTFAMTIGSVLGSLYKTDNDTVSFRYLKFNDDNIADSLVITMTMDGVEILNDTVSLKYQRECVDKGALEEAINAKADKATTIAGYGITDAYTKTEIDAKVASVYHYKGTVSAYAGLPASGQEVGDVWNIETADSTHGIKAGDNVAWTGAEWDVLAGEIDLSAYATKTELETKMDAPATGTVGQVLTKTADGQEWADALAGGGDTHDSTDYLCFTNVMTKGVKVKFKAEYMDASNINLEYSTDKITWNDVVFSDGYSNEILLLNIGDKVWFRGNNSSFSKALNECIRLTGDNVEFGFGNLRGYISGNVMSLIDKTCSSLTIPSNNCFSSLFSYLNCTYNISLPAVNLKPYCYAGMFSHNNSTTKVPKLPAINVPECAYYRMFEASKMKDGGYIDATNWNTDAYKEMFKSCSNLNHLKVNFTSWKNTTDWLSGVSSTGVFECPSALDCSTRDASHVPAGWTIVRTDAPKSITSPTTASSEATYDVSPNTPSVPVVTVASALTLNASAIDNGSVTYAEIVLDVASGATVTAGTNLTLVDTPTAGKRNICVCRWSGGVCKLYVTIVEDLPQA